VHQAKDIDILGEAMVITLSPDLEVPLYELARRQGVAPEALALKAIRDCIIALTRKYEPRDDWERMIAELGTNCGVSLPDSVLSSEGLYE
jgi:hypothetical protein